MEGSNADSSTSNAHATSTASEDILLPFDNLGLGTNNSGTSRNNDADTCSDNNGAFVSSSQNASAPQSQPRDNVLSDTQSTRRSDDGLINTEQPGLPSSCLSPRDRILPDQDLNGNGQSEQMSRISCLASSSSANQLNPGQCLSYPTPESSQGYGYNLNDFLNQTAGEYGGQQSQNPGQRTMDGAADGQSVLEAILQGWDHGCTEVVLGRGLQGLIELMTDSNGRHVFIKLLDTCNGNQLHRVVSLLELDQCRVVGAAFTKIGSNSLQILISKVNNTPHARRITKILSCWVFELMTHQEGRYVIQECLIQFRAANEILYDGIISLYLHLAIHKVGYRALNVCINNITGRHREILLDRIADMSRRLCYEPYGNFVLQHVVSLRNEEITSKIVNILRYHLVGLAMSKNGSYLVQKCMQFSELGMSLVVVEIIRSEAAFWLSRDVYGNHVIREALLRTKANSQLLHEQLVMAIKPHYASLMSTKHGKHIAEMVRDEDG